MEQKVPVKQSKQVEEVGNWWCKMVAASTTHESLDAARDFGFQTRLTIRPGNPLVDDPHGHLSIESFELL